MAFGPAHLAALAVLAAVACGVVALARRSPACRWPLRLGLAATIAGLLAFELTTAVVEGWLSWKTVLPLELCDAATLLAVVSLLVPRRSSAEILYFWSGSGSLLAMLTPDLQWNFPRWEFVVFFGLHGLVLVAGLLLVFGLGLRPARGAIARAGRATLLWAGLATVANLSLGTNFMYLMAKPTNPSVLDWLGPWPVYLAGAALLALSLFALLSLPFRAEWRRPEGA